jgi:hypothetical protein
MLIPIRDLKAYNEDPVGYDSSFRFVQITPITISQRPSQSQRRVQGVLGDQNQPSGLLVRRPGQLRPQEHFIWVLAGIFPHTCMLF